LQVLGERGFHAARIDDIVRAAAVSHGTFYLYFANKDDLVRALAVRGADEMSDLVGTLGPVGPGPDGLAELESWLGRFVALYRAYGVVIRAWMEDQVASRDLSRLEVKTFAAMAGGLVARIREARPDLSSHQAELQAAALLAMIERFTYCVSSRGLGVVDDDDDDAMVSTLAVLIHRGFFAGPASAGTRRRDPVAR
jgi:AcrR family transcriptional regulator